VHPGFAQWTHRGSNGETSLTKNDVLDDITLYWLTDSGASSARLYWENGTRNVVSAASQKTAQISLPVAITVFPGESYQAPETWARRAYPNLIYFHEVDKGGHFAAWEQPELFASELHAAFKPLRGPVPGVVEPQQSGTRRTEFQPFASTNDLASALRRAAAAHRQHEARTGQADPNWPDWYAEYMVTEHVGDQSPQ